LVVGHVDERDPDLVLESLEEELHLLAELQVERAQGLVEEEDARVVHEGPGQGHPLLLAPRELGDPAALHARQLHQPEHLGDPSSDVRLGNALAAEAVGDVLEHVEVGEQGV
jgi:hypothetical protein